MTELTWDLTGKRLFETGVDHGILFPADSNGEYPLGVAWNGLTSISESPSGAESNKQYADNIPYLNLISAELYGATLAAFSYPKEFGPCDGSAEPSPGVFIGQQGRQTFGLAYRTLLGNDTEGTDHGYKLHLVWGCTAAPSEQEHTTVNESPEAMEFSWEISTIPVSVTGHKPTASMTLDSTEVDEDILADLLEIINGSVGEDPRLPLPDEILTMFAAGVLTDVELGLPANQPTYNAGTHVTTLPAVTGVQWKINGVNKAAGAQPALTVGQVANVKATPLAGYHLVGSDDWVFNY